MAFRVSRVLSRQLRSLSTTRSAPQQAIYQVERRFSAEAAEDDIVKQTFLKQQSQFREYLKLLEGTKIPVDPEDAKGVKDYAESLKKIRNKLGVPSLAEKLSNTLEAAVEDSDTVRTFLENAKTVREEFDISDDLGAEQLMFEALESVESKLGKPLVAGDPKGMQLWSEALNSINSKLKLSEGQLEKLEEELEVELAKEDVAQMKAEAEEKMSTYKRRDGLEAIKVDLKELDPRAYL